MSMWERWYQRAYEIAKKAHEGQTDKGGNPYFLHPLEVAEGVESPQLKIIALLHDVLEDSEMTKQELEDEGFPAEVVEAVCVLTHSGKDRQGYFAYIRRVKTNALATAVKISDLRHNLDLSRIPKPQAGDYARCEKYKKALAFLQGEIPEI